MFMQCKLRLHYSLSQLRTKATITQVSISGNVFSRYVLLKHTLVHADRTEEVSFKSYLEIKKHKQMLQNVSEYFSYSTSVDPSNANNGFQYSLTILYDTTLQLSG